MNVNYIRLCNAVNWAFLIGSSLFTALCLAGAKLRGAVRWLIYITLGICAALYLALSLSVCLWAVFVIFLVMPLFSKKAFGFGSCQAVISALLAFDITFIIRMYLGVFHSTPYFMLNKSSLWIDSTGSITVLLLGILVYNSGVTIFPSKHDINLCKKSRRERELNKVSLSAIFILLLFSVWLSYIAYNGLSFVRQKFLITSFATVFLIICISHIKIIAFGIMGMQNSNVGLSPEANAFMQKVRSQRHDFNFHLQSIKGMLESENYSECIDYLKQIIGEAQKINDTLPIYYPAVSALLNSFRESAAKKDIDIKISVFYNMEHIACTVIELNKIIGNLIQNAIDETEKLPPGDKDIQITLAKRSGHCVIRVSNKVREIDLRQVLVFGYTTKTAHEGIGLNTVDRIVSKYNGVLFPEQNGNIVHFIVHMPIVLK